MLVKGATVPNTEATVSMWHLLFFLEFLFGTWVGVNAGPREVEC